jgi:toxin ParE1/3/4
MSRRAEMDLAEITNFIALDNPARAFEFEEELLEHARRIECAPLAYAKRADLGDGLRSCVHGAYVIFFRLDDQGVRIERILHGSRDLGTLLEL